MVVFISFRRFIALILIKAVTLGIVGIAFYYWHYTTVVSSTVVDAEIKDALTREIEKIIEIRNSALLNGNKDLLGTLYNKDVRNGVWAYESEVQKMGYLQEWAHKQGALFRDISSLVVVRNIKKKGNGYTLHLLVSTEYQYKYEDNPLIYNSFKIGTSHSLDLISKGDRWLINKEWYGDPLAKSIALDDAVTNQFKGYIIEGEDKKFPDLSEARLNAVAYAHQYSGAANILGGKPQYNPKYVNFKNQGGDCTNFASQVMYEGGNFKKNSTWNYAKGAGSKAWVNAHAFNSFMLNSGRASLIARGTYQEVFKATDKLLPGDYIGYEKKGRVAHIAIVTDVDTKGYALVNSHDADRFRVPWDLGWNEKGIKFWLVRVNY